ncbi:MAG: RNA polymerase sigma factor [Bacteroidales bacterium]|nr:RNA polymerase sigma factor [Bacteroidales bacterium]
MTTAEFNICVDKFADNVYRFILKNIKDEDKAKDVVQDSFEKMWLKVDDIAFEKSRSYLFTTAYHTMIDMIRKDKKKSDFDEIEPYTQGYKQEYMGLKEIIESALEKLPEIQKNVVLLRDYEGYSYEEIGQITGLNETQVKVYIYRARLTMKNFIGSLEKIL